MFSVLVMNRGRFFLLLDGPPGSGSVPCDIPEQACSPVYSPSVVWRQFSCPALCTHFKG